ncbi:Gfo/Idh/MocA family oxidoreductase [Flavivirga spongiicola]|uniref:Gfo/Idh/MocA family oxidoreductase n=1 Tax=Flavivirga spongiicola TaxID=421621 RepID=A0ABU7XSY2_9FLAO|nr:Gfo/Idh/MocA family oxidoreductase [Flavivirga sp. MEBiC05379]MDO5978853.1 Gfo/Idh/MocA family oxidoreductase [Flavivirga sp. MEBiC05379]
MLKLGVIGLSEGNGHPYSWSAIFNGYNPEIDCPFTVIPEYLDKENFPNNFLSHLGKVTHIWTQDKEKSESVANFALIENIVDEPQDMLGEVDAILLARDDAETHYELAKVFIENNIPLFIDKPLAYTLDEAIKIYSIGSKESLIFTCSSIRFAKEFSIKVTEGTNFVSATVMKSWEKYGIHVLEPVVSMFPNRGQLLSVNKVDMDLGLKVRVVEWEKLKAVFIIAGSMKAPIKIDLMNKNYSKSLIFQDTFYAFRESLRFFIGIIEKREKNIPKEETLEIIEIIDKGL